MEVLQLGGSTEHVEHDSGREFSLMGVTTVTTEAVGHKQSVQIDSGVKEPNFLKSLATKEVGTNETSTNVCRSKAPKWPTIHDTSFLRLGIQNSTDTAVSNSNDQSASVGVMGRIGESTTLSQTDKGTNSSVGEQVIKAGEVLKTAATFMYRQPQVNCRVETFGRMCDKFDDLRKRWVREMGFGGLLNLRDKQLPRSLCYWLMTRIDPESESFVTTNGKSYRISKNQVSWVLGIPIGSKPVPKRVEGPDLEKRVEDLKSQYGKEWEFTNKITNKVVKCRGIHISAALIDRAEEKWDESEEFEFKKLFLLLALHLVLCPVQGPRLGSDLAVAVCCSENSLDYDWCSLLVEKLMESVISFAKRFSNDGYAGGCGGCSIFLAIFYLDRLKRKPVKWGVCPRIKAWTMDDIRKACHADRYLPNGDYGKLNLLDIAYGEQHPGDVRDLQAPYCVDVQGDTSPPRKFPKRIPDRRGNYLKYSCCLRKASKMQ